MTELAATVVGLVALLATYVLGWQIASQVADHAGRRKLRAVLLPFVASGLLLTAFGALVLALGGKAGIRLIGLGLMGAGVGQLAATFMIYRRRT